MRGDNIRQRIITPTRKLGEDASGTPYDPFPEAHQRSVTIESARECSAIFRRSRNRML